MRTLTLAGAVAAVAGLNVGILLSSAALGDTQDDGGRTTWTVAPVAVDGDGERVSIRHDLDLGTSVTDAVEVRNFGPAAATFQIYASDGVVGVNGAFDVLPPGQESTDSGTWVQFGDVPSASADSADPLTVRVEPASSIEIPFTITAPDGAVPGDHPAGIVAELVPEDEHNVQLTSRVGVRLHLRVTGELQAQVVATDVDSSWSSGWNPFASGDVGVSYQLQNTGNVRLGATTQLQLSGPFGLLPLTVTDTRREILPGEAVPVVSELPRWGLLWTPGTITVTPAVVGEDAPAAEITPTTTELGILTIPWPQTVVVLMIVIALSLRRRRRRRQEHAVQARIDAAVAEARAEHTSTHRTEEAAGT